jgi:hypothetical protein
MIGEGELPAALSNPFVLNITLIGRFFRKPTFAVPSRELLRRPDLCHEDPRFSNGSDGRFWFDLRVAPVLNGGLSYSGLRQPNYCEPM